MSPAPSSSPEAIQTAFRQQGFIATGELSTTLHLTECPGKPLLLEGPPERELNLNAPSDYGLSRGVEELVRRIAR